MTDELIPEIPKKPEDVVDKIPHLDLEDQIEATEDIAPPESISSTIPEPTEIKQDQAKMPPGMAGVMAALATNPGLANLAAELVKLANNFMSRGQNDRVGRFLELQDQVMMYQLARQTVGAARASGMSHEQIRAVIKPDETTTEWA